MRMKHEYQLRNLKKWTHENPDVRAFCSLLIAMPHILHGEMRIALKILTMILIQGYSNCHDGILYPNIGGAGPERFDQCVSDAENLINTQTLGNEFNPSQ